MAGVEGGRRNNEDEHRVPWGADAITPSGPAEGFAIGEAITKA
ncbi:hypothetical protein ACWD4J_26820 [Streptomyces sp. NPDC002577]